VKLGMVHSLRFGTFAQVIIGFLGIMFVQGDTLYIHIDLAGIIG